MSPLVSAGLFASIFLASICAASAIRYRICNDALEIIWLFLTVRRIRMDEIKYISTKPVWYSEKWHNTVRVRNRRLVIYRRDALKRPVSISPRNPFVFSAELDHAIARASPRKIKVLSNVDSKGALVLAH